MNFDSIKNIRPSGLDISNADAQYADYIGSLPQHKSKKQIIAVISTVAAAVLVVVAVSIWAIIGSGFRSKSNNDPIITPAAADDNVQKPENTKPTDTDTPQKPEQSATNDTKPPVTDKDTPTKLDPDDNAPTEKAPEDNVDSNYNGAPEDNSGVDDKTPTEPSPVPNEDKCIIKIKSGTTLYVSSEEFVFGISTERQNEARQLAEIIKNATYTKTDCDCYADVNVYFGASRKAEYMIFRNSLLSTVHIKSAEGECQFNKADSEKIIELLDWVCTIDNSIKRSMPEEIAEHMSFCDAPETDDSKPHVPSAICYSSSVFSESVSLYDDNASYQLKKLLESFEYSEPRCNCHAKIRINYEYPYAQSPSIFTTYDYSLVIERDAKRAHVKTEDGMYFLSESELNTIIELILKLRKKPEANGYAAAIDPVPAKKEVTISHSDVIVRANESDAYDLVHYFDFNTYYTDDFHSCDKYHSTVMLDDVEYGFCTCDDPHIFAPCATKAVSSELIKQLLEKVQSVFEQTE